MCGSNMPIFEYVEISLLHRRPMCSQELNQQLMISVPFAKQCASFKRNYEQRLGRGKSNALREIKICENKIDVYLRLLSQHVDPLHSTSAATTKTDTAYSRRRKLNMISVSQRVSTSAAHCACAP